MMQLLQSETFSETDLPGLLALFFCGVLGWATTRMVNDRYAFCVNNAKAQALQKEGSLLDEESVECCLTLQSSKSARKRLKRKASGVKEVDSTQTVEAADEVEVTDMDAPGVCQWRLDFDMLLSAYDLFGGSSAQERQAFKMQTSEVELRSLEDRATPSLSSDTWIKVVSKRSAQKIQTSSSASDSIEVGAVDIVVHAVSGSLSDGSSTHEIASSEKDERLSVEDLPTGCSSESFTGDSSQSEQDATEADHCSHGHGCNLCDDVTECSDWQPELLLTAADMQDVVTLTPDAIKLQCDINLAKLTQEWTPHAMVDSMVVQSPQSPSAFMPMAGTDGIQTWFEPVDSTDGTALYTDGQQFYEAVYIKVDQTPDDVYCQQMPADRSYAPLAYDPHYAAMHSACYNGLAMDAAYHMAPVDENFPYTSHAKGPTFLDDVEDEEYNMCWDFVPGAW